MHTSISSSELEDYIKSQISHFFPDNKTEWREAVSDCCSEALKRVEHCFRGIRGKYYQSNGLPVFNHMNSDHYATFLYFLANQAYLTGNIPLAEKAFYLNKLLNGLDLFYSIEMPEIFLLVHPVGSVIGNAEFSDYLVIYQNVTIGSDKDGVYPSFSGSNVLYSGASVIGNCQLGSNTVIGARSFLRKLTDSEDNRVYSGMYPNVRSTPNNRSVKEDFFMENPV